MAVQAQTQNQARAQWLELPRADYVLVSIALALLIIGLMMVWSVTFMPGVERNAQNPQWEFMKQAGFALIGLMAMIVLMHVDYRIWGRLAVPLMIATVVILALLIIFGTATNNSRRWLFEGSFQPSEAAKFTVILYIAKWLSSKGEKLRVLTYGLLPFGIIVGAVTGLVLLQPNLSTAVIIALCAMSMFFIAGADIIQFIFMTVIGSATVALVIAKTPYLLSRWLVYTAPDPVTLGTKESYQIAQALIALGSGGFLGRGVGEGLAKFGYLPAANNDSIFAIIGEEMGLIGSWAVLALFLALAYRGFRIAAKTKDPFGQVFASGITFWLIFQAFVNIGVVTHSIPYTGVPLPFISYGGSALVMALAAVGVLLNISRNGRVLAEERDASFDFGWRDGGTRVSGTSRRRRNSETRSRTAQTRGR